MIKITILNEYRRSPIWACDEGGKITDLPQVVEEDAVLIELSKDASDLFDSYYEFGVDDEACKFNTEKEKKGKYLMLHDVYSIISRLNKINDGSFTVVDCESEQLKSL